MGLQFMQEMLELTKMQSMNQLAQLQVREPRVLIKNLSIICLFLHSTGGGLCHR